MVTVPYTLEQARIDVAALRGQVDLLSEMLTQADLIPEGQVPNTPSSGASQFSTSGYQKYVSANDAAPYVNGVQTAQGPAGGQGVNGAAALLTGMSVNLGVGTYLYEAWVQIVGTGNVTGNCYPAGTATTSDFRCFGVVIGNAVATTMKVQSVLGTSNISFTVVNGTQYFIMLHGSITTTVAGTLQIWASSSANPGFNTGDDSTLRAWPLV